MAENALAEHASFESLLSRADIGHFEKGTGPLEDCLTRLRALLSELEQVVPIYNLSISVWPTAKH